MKIGFLLSTKGGSPLQIGLERGLAQLGHAVTYGAGDGCEILLVFNQVTHDTRYAYPELPNRWPPFAFIDCAEYGFFRRFPWNVGQYWNTFAPGALAHDTKNAHEQTRLKEWLSGKSFPYFIREFSKHVSFPKGYRPIDYPLYLHSECHEAPNREEYLNRQEDLFLSWGASHPWRLNITEALRECPVRSKIFVLEENGTPRMPQKEYFRRTRGAKTSVSFDGYGSSAFRLHEVLVRTLLLLGPLSIHRHAPLVDGVHCLEYSIESDGEKFLGTNIREKLAEALADPDRAYRLYEAGYHHCMQHYTEKATAQYVLDVISKHDWNVPTAL